MKTYSRLNSPAFVAALGLLLSAQGVSAAPRTNPVHSQLQMSVTRTLSESQIAKSGLDATGATSTNRVDSVTHANMMASTARLGEANTVSKNFSTPSFNFSHGAQITKSMKKPAAGVKINRLSGKTEAAIHSGLRTSNVRKLSMIKTF